MVGYEWGAVSDRGDIRKENQDHILCLMGEILGTPAALFAVADGMGGLALGAQMSHLVVLQLLGWWGEDFQQMVQLGKNSQEDICDLLDQVIWDINQSALAFCAENHCRCGSTLSLLLLYGEEYYIKNIGDSRVYLAHDGSLRQLTEDQSYVAQMVREKKMTEEEAKRSKKRNLLTMCIGAFEQIQAFSAEGVLEPGDVFLLCSDGLYNPLERELMEAILVDSSGTAPETAQQLRDSVRAGAAADNISAITVKTYTKE